MRIPLKNRKELANFVKKSRKKEAVLSKIRGKNIQILSKDREKMQIS